MPGVVDGRLRTHAVVHLCVRCTDDHCSTFEIIVGVLGMIGKHKTQNRHIDRIYPCRLLYNPVPHKHRNTPAGVFGACDSVEWRGLVGETEVEG